MGLLLLFVTGCSQNPQIDFQLIGADSFLAETIAVEQGKLFRGTFSPDGKEFYFFQNVAEGEDYRVFSTQKKGSSWSQPEMMPLGDANVSSLYPAISPDGRFLVFTSYRSTGDSTNNANLWAAEKGDEGWGTPFFLEGASTKVNYDAGPWFGPDGTLRFTSTSPDWRESWPRTVSFSNGTFGAWQEDTFWNGIDMPSDQYHFWSGTVNHSGTAAVMEFSERLPDGSLGDADLWIATKGPEGWSIPVPFGPSVNTDVTENFPSFSYDDSRLVFVRDFSAFFIVELAK